MILKTGDRFPNFTVSTEAASGIDTDAMIKDADKTVFWVLRYIGCPTCRWDIHQILLNYDKFKAAGAQVYVVMQSEPVTVNRDLKDYPIPFRIICDPKQEIYRTLEIRATETKEERMPKTEEGLTKFKGKIDSALALGFQHGDFEGNEQQLPALFITDQAGTVLYSHYAENSIDMPSVDEVLALL